MTKIGKTINNLTKSKDNRIKDISNKLLNIWKKIVKNQSSSSDNLIIKTDINEKSMPSQKINQNNPTIAVKDHIPKSSAVGCKTFVNS